MTEYSSDSRVWSSASDLLNYPGNLFAFALSSWAHGGNNQAARLHGNVNTKWSSWKMALVPSSLKVQAFLSGMSFRLPYWNQDWTSGRLVTGESLKERERELDSIMVRTRPVSNWFNKLWPDLAAPRNIPCSFISYMNRGGKKLNNFKKVKKAISTFSIRRLRNTPSVLKYRAF